MIKATTSATKSTPTTQHTTITAIAVVFGKDPIYSVEEIGSPPTGTTVPSSVDENPGST